MSPFQLARRGLIIGAAALGLTLASCNQGGEKADGAPETITFAILPAESQASSEPLWRPLIEDMSRETGLNVEMRFVSNYALLVQAMQAGQVQVGWFSALPALEATERANGQVIGRIVDRNGNADYQSVLIVRKGSGITLDDVLACGKRYTFGAGDARSTSGTLAPMAFLFGPRGIEPSECFSQVRAANHQANALGVANGVVDVATNNSVGLVFMARQFPQQAEQLEVIWRSPPIPESSIVVRRDLDPAITEKIRSFFLTYGTAEGAEGERQREILRGLEYGGFREAGDSYLDPIREMEASVALVEARRSGDQARIAQAEAEYEAIRNRTAVTGAERP
ncbi:phosphate/phosphite/phosphonate ABC transporter substrate-binding protein [Brevundimonas sp. 2R-24]|uniref:Phosphate/phosphite/phosphonate ABC transporter substrate-binding protein n=1 Tax=Peiella sedimenti TaxID=3061083 RepID=A0ABT8SNM9_9CAUL|nr:phosphate/phosphite/phosphonate ABC transporter substrate-binding protein [Caulobacteraceae bacterium XZ-24]